MPMNSENTETFTITKADIKSITDIEFAFSTTRFLPAEKQIPSEFFKGNIYTKFVENLFFGVELPSGTIEFKFDLKPEEVQRFIISHLKSFEPKHEIKIAGVGYLLHLLGDLKPHED